MHDKDSPRTKPCDSRIPRCGQRSPFAKSLPEAERHTAIGPVGKLAGTTVPSKMSADAAIGTHPESVSAAIFQYFPYPTGSPGFVHIPCTFVSKLSSPRTTRTHVPTCRVFGTTQAFDPFPNRCAQPGRNRAQLFIPAPNNQSDCAGPRVIVSTQTSKGPRRHPTSSASIRSGCPLTLNTASPASL